MSQDTTSPTTTRYVSSISLARLINLGNYEHLRVEFTISLGPKDDPGAVVDDVCSVLADIEEKPPVPDYSLREANQTIKKAADPAVAANEKPSAQEIAEALHILEVSDAYKQRKQGIKAKLSALNGTMKKEKAKGPLFHYGDTADDTY